MNVRQNTLVALLLKSMEMLKDFATECGVLPISIRLIRTTVQ